MRSRVGNFCPKTARLLTKYLRYAIIPSMNEITQITPQIKDKRRCNVYVDGRFYCGLTLETAIKNRLKVGQIVSLETLSDMQLESEKDVAFDKALTHLSATRKTEKHMREFLEKKGYLPAVIEYVMDKLRGYEFVNDGEYAKAYVGFTADKKGGRLIRMELKQKGISDEEIDGAMESISAQAQEETATRILQKYMKSKESTRENLQKAFRYLMGKGFDADTVKLALQTYGELEEE